MRTLAAEGRTVLLSSHLMSEMSQTADRLIVIGRGRILADGAVGDVVGSSASLEDAYLALTAGDVEYHSTLTATAHDEGALR
jgi:ABC-2 type transport system ATP-binding protein